MKSDEKLSLNGESLQQSNESQNYRRKKWLVISAVIFICIASLVFIGIKISNVVNCDESCEFARALKYTNGDEELAYMLVMMKKNITAERNTAMPGTE